MFRNAAVSVVMKQNFMKFFAVRIKNNQVNIDFVSGAGRFIDAKIILPAEIFLHLLNIRVVHSLVHFGIC